MVVLLLLKGLYKGQKLADLYVQFPVSRLDRLIICEGVLCHLAGLKTQQGAPQVSVGGLGNALTQWIWQLEALFLCYVGQHVLHLWVRGCSHTYAQTPASNWFNDLQPSDWYGMHTCFLRVMPSHCAVLKKGYV